MTMGSADYVPTQSLFLGQVRDTGVHFDSKRGLWVAQIMFQHKAYLLGRFKYKREAIKARRAGEDKYFGKYR